MTLVQDARGSPLDHRGIATTRKECHRESGGEVRTGRNRGKVIEPERIAALKGPKEGENVNDGSQLRSKRYDVVCIKNRVPKKGAERGVIKERESSRGGTSNRTPGEFGTTR